MAYFWEGFFLERLIIEIARYIILSGKVQLFSEEKRGVTTQTKATKETRSRAAGNEV